MKATLLANGFLKVSAETSTEAYALKRWWADLGSIVDGNGSGLAVELEVPLSETERQIPLGQLKA